MIRMGMPALAASLLSACMAMTDARAQEGTEPEQAPGSAPVVAAGSGPDPRKRTRRATRGPRARAVAAPRSRPAGRAANQPATERAARVEGAVAAPPNFIPGTLDFGNGVSMTANYTGEIAGNPVGGQKGGTRYADQVFVGVDLDLGKIAGLEDASLHAIGTKRSGRSLTTDLVGNSVAAQQIYGGGQTWRLTYLSFQQKFLGGRIDLEVGRIPGTATFLASPLYCSFLSGAVCGGASLAFTDTNFTYWPAPTWGGVLRTKLTDTVFFNVGAYEVVPTVGLRADHGTDVFAPATGFNVPMELGYSTTFDNDALPRNYIVGAIVDRSSYRDSVVDQEGSVFLFSGQDPVERFGRSIVYGRFDQMVWRPDPESRQGLTLFGIAAKGTEGRQLLDHQLTFGLSHRGLFEGRSFDTLGFMVSTQRYSDVGLSNVRAGRESLGLSTSNIARNQTFMELNYGIQLSPAARLTPSVQYIIDPDQLRYPLRQKPIPDALVLGGRLSVDLFTLAGLAKGPGSL